MTPPNTTALPGLLYGAPIPLSVWEGIRTEFGLPTLDQVRARLASIHPNPEPVMGELVRVFVGTETLCPGYQFTDTLTVKPTVKVLFVRALELRIAHNYFTAWITTPSPDLEDQRPADLLHSPTPPLLRGLENFKHQRVPTPTQREDRVKAWN